MSIYVSNSSHSLNTTDNSSEHKKSTSHYGGFYNGAFILSTAAGINSVIHAYIDVDRIASFFISDPAVASRVALLVVPIFSFWAGAFLWRYSRRSK